MEGYEAMGVNLQILFFISIIALQVILITTIIKGFKTFRETVNFMKQKGSTVEICSCKEYKAKNKKNAEKPTEKREKRIKNLDKTSKGEELLFMEQVKLNKKDPITKINITVDRKEK